MNLAMLREAPCRLQFESRSFATSERVMVRLRFYTKNPFGGALRARKRTYSRPLTLSEIQYVGTLGAFRQCTLAWWLERNRLGRRLLCSPPARVFRCRCRYCAVFGAATADANRPPDELMISRLARILIIKSFVYSGRSLDHSDRRLLDFSVRNYCFTVAIGSLFSYYFYIHSVKLRCKSVDLQ